MTKEDVRLALGILDVHGRLILRMAIFDGMRPGEIFFAILLRKISGNSVLIDRCFYCNNMDTPKGRKGKNTSRTVALSPGTVADLGIWRSFLSERDGDALLFPQRRASLRYDRPICGNGKFVAIGAGRTGVGQIPGFAKDQCEPFPERRRSTTKYLQTSMRTGR